MSLKLPKRRIMVTLCESCASRYIKDYVALVAPPKIRDYDGQEWTEPVKCETCGAMGFFFTYALPEWKRGESK